jgi:uncharacterized protein YjbI with pentapeptide repeats
MVGKPGASMSRADCAGDVNLIAVDLSGSGIASLPRDLDYECIALAAVRFPSELVSIGTDCFFSCASLTEVDLSRTSVVTLRFGGFRSSGVVRFQRR